MGSQGTRQRTQEPFNWLQWAALRKERKEGTQARKEEAETSEDGSKDSVKVLASECKDETGNT